MLLYFVGHGIALDGEDGPEGYLNPAGAREDDRSTFVATADSDGWLEALHCRHLPVILDCCAGRKRAIPRGRTRRGD